MDIDKILIAISHYISPSRVALLLGVSEAELRSFIIDSPNNLSKVRDTLFNQQMEATQTALEMIEKKPPTDFLLGVGEKHFDLWSRFIATDIQASSDYVLVDSAIKGGIGLNKDFWKSATNNVKMTFKHILKDDIAFTRFFFDVVEGHKFNLGKHHIAIFDELKKVEQNSTDVLIINLPPRVGKSTSVYAWACRQLMQKPNSNIIYGSYGEVVLTLIRKRIDTAFAKSNYEKNEINPFYEIFNVGKAKGFDKESDFLTDINSAFFSATMAGGITGRGYSVYADANGAMILDDANNPNDVGTLRMETILEKFDTTWKSRKGKNPLVIVMQRVADNDLTSHVIETYKDSGLNVRVLTLPMEMTSDVDEYISKQQAKYPNIVFIDPLKHMNMGETLLSAKDVEYIRANMHPSIYKTQYLQIPTSLEGSIFKSKMFYNKVVGIEPITNSINEPIGYVRCNCLKRSINDDSITEIPVDFEGVFVLHIDTTSGNTDTSTKDVDDCVWSLCVGGLKGRAKIKDNFYGAILQQYAINSKEASEDVMQNTTLEIIEKITALYNRDTATFKNPIIIVAIETHSQGGGLASFIRGKNLPNVYTISYSRQNFGDKKQRFIQGAGFYEDRIFWWQEDKMLFPMTNIKTNTTITINDWYYNSRVQHLSVDGENQRIHDDYVEAPTDICNLWIANEKDKIFQEYNKLRKGA